MVSLTTAPGRWVWLLKSPTARQFCGDAVIFCRERSLSGGQYRLRMLMAELSTVILTLWILACWLVSTLKSEAAMLFWTSINTCAFLPCPTWRFGSLWWEICGRCSGVSLGCRPHQHLLYVVALWVKPFCWRLPLYSTVEFWAVLWFYQDQGFSANSIYPPSPKPAPHIRTGWPPVTWSGPFWSTGPSTLPARWDTTDRTPSHIDLKFSIHKTWLHCTSIVCHWLSAAGFGVGFLVWVSLS